MRINRVLLGLIVYLCSAPICCLAQESVAQAFLDEGNRLYVQGDYEAAQRLFQQAKDATTDKNSLSYATVLNNLGESCWKRAMTLSPGTGVSDADVAALKKVLFNLAVQNLTESVTKKEARLGSFSLVVARGLENLGEVYMDSYQNDQAEALFRKALSIRLTKQGPGVCDELIDNMRLGDIYADRLPSSAIGFYETALSIASHCYKPEDPMKGLIYEKLASPYYLQGKLTKAGESYDKAVEIYKHNRPSSDAALDRMTTRLKELTNDLYVSAYRTAQQNSTGDKRILSIKQLAIACRRAGYSDDANYLDSLVKADIAKNSHSSNPAASHP